MKKRAVDFTSIEKKKPLKGYQKLLIAGGVVTGASFLLTLVPCKISDKTGSALGFCKLPNPLINLQTTSHYYYNYTNNPLTGLVLQMAIATLLCYGLVYSVKKLNFKRKNHKILDFTKKDR